MRHFHLSGGRICGLAFLPDGQSLVVREKSGFGQSCLRWYDRATMREWAKRETQNSPFTLTPNYLRLAYQTPNGISRGVEVWDIMRNTPVASLELDAQYVTAMCFSPDGEVLWLGIEEYLNETWANCLWTWKIAEGWCEKHHCASHIGNIACSNNGRWLAFSEDLDIRVMDRWNNCILDSWKRQDGVPRLIFSPQDRYLSTIRGPGAVLWDMTARKLGPVLGGHSGQVHDVDFSADARIAGTAGDDGTVRLWEAATGRLLRTFAWDIGPLETLAFSPDGLTAATGGADGQLLAWDMDDM